MPDNRDVLAQMLAAGQTGGLGTDDFTTFANKLNNPDALKSWYDAGGIWGQYGGTPPDPDEQYFANRGPFSHSGDDSNWMYGLQPWQGGASGTLPGSGINTSGYIGGGGATRADPSYWGWQGPHRGYAPGSMGDMSGFNAGRGGGTGGLSPQDFAIFSRAITAQQGPQALQDWLNAGGVQGQFGGDMGGAVGGGGSVGGGGGATGPGQGQSQGQSPSQGPNQGQSTSSGFGAGATGFNGYGAGGTGLAGGFSNGGYDMGYGTVGFGNGFGSTGYGTVGSPTGPGTVGGFGTGNFGGGIGIGGLGAIAGSVGDNDQGYGSPF